MDCTLRKGGNNKCEGETLSKFVADVILSPAEESGSPV